MSKRKRDSYFEESDEGSPYCNDSESDDPDTDWEKLDMTQLFPKSKRKLDFPPSKTGVKFYSSTGGRKSTSSSANKEDLPAPCNR